MRNETNNTAIRAGLYNDNMSGAELTEWLDAVSMQRNKSIKPKAPQTYPKPVSGKLEVDDIQGCILWGYGGLKHAQFLMLRFTDATKSRQWLRKVVDRLEPAGFHELDDVSENLAFTHDGLRALGLNDETLNTFSFEFRTGMTTAHKQRQLGDTGKSAPESWAWGGPNNPDVHATLLLYADTADRLDALENEHRDWLAQFNIEIVHTLDARELPGRKEHFGFRDGISQPFVHGQYESAPADQQRPEPAFNTLNAGEFVLGYQNGFAEGDFMSYPATATVSPELDTKNLLPENVLDPSEKDFGRNGSYLVFRTLAQDVKAFWSYLNEKSDQQHAHSVKLGAKMVGRWPSGAPLAVYPDADPNPEMHHLDDANSPSNMDRFAYHRKSDAEGNDQHGMKCPFGSHLRRSNIRDDMEDVTPTRSMIIANQHRILRRGRPYGSQKIDPSSPDFTPEHAPTEEVGLQFLCFNANLQRQFEFIQSTWSNNPFFHTQTNNPDPISGVFDPEVNDTNGVHNMQHCPVRKQADGLTRFVQTRGGAYFFMPGIQAIRYLAKL